MQKQFSVASAGWLENVSATWGRSDNLTSK